MKSALILIIMLAWMGDSALAVYAPEYHVADERGVNGAASCWFTYSTAHFVGSDGKVYPLWATANRKKEKWKEAAMDKAVNGVHGICAEAVNKTE